MLCEAWGKNMAYDDHVVSVLTDLLQNARDSEYGFRTCAEQIESANVKNLFADRARGCADAAQELESLIIQYGGEPAAGGTVAGALHRGWVQFKGAVGADSELSILEWCERSEDSGIARYRKALQADLPADVRIVIERQATGAQKNHDQIQNLRNAVREQGN